ncbi:MAG: Gfo/Idh/MocA family oxidoreductase [Rhodothermia bacterium]|nr:Gfo/Idh/MocA family oxidoreductase [Rhodothermia bacterium]
MKKNESSEGSERLSRRTFIKKSSLVPLAGFFGAGADEASYLPASVVRADRVDDPVRIGLIGYGQWGREIADTLSRMPEADLVTICDSYDVMLKRAERSYPDADRTSEYAALLDRDDVGAVIIATPTHQHKQIALDALAADKHVYCEAPMASTIDDAAVIARAAREATDQVFQVGLIYRSNPQHRNIFQFIRSGAIGTPAMARAQWHSKESWRRASPNREREQALNWRLDESISLGLVGEHGIHQIDTTSWILRGLPSAVTGFGSIVLWNDGREVPDTVQAVLEYPRGVNMTYDASLATSFDDAYDMFYGSDSTIMLRDSKGWMFKEVDAPLLGWEVYARKDTFYREKGIALVANATQLEAQGQDPAADDPNVETPLFYALKEFIDNNVYGPFESSAGYRVGFDANVIAIKANEAVTSRSRVEIDPALFEIG